jgi:DNA-directed RNA polymerase specialized sigma24 family protein
MAVMRPDETSAEPPGWETIEELFAALESPLLGYALRYTGDRALAEDVVQEAFMKLHAQFDRSKSRARGFTAPFTISRSTSGARRAKPFRSSNLLR